MIPGDLSLSEREAILRGIWPKIEDALRAAGFDPVLASYTGSTPDGGLEASVRVAFGSRPASYQGAFFDLADYQVTGPDTPLADVARNVLRKHRIRSSRTFGGIGRMLASSMPDGRHGRSSIHLQAAASPSNRC
jgi:hypothetical protein